jgi:hypothetical protein
MCRLYWVCGLCVALAATAASQDPEPDPDVVPTAATVKHPPRPSVTPPDCPPPVLPFDPSRPPVVPFDPSRPPTVPPTVPPTEPSAAPPRAPEGGGLSGSTFNPNMWGDIFGSQPRALQISSTRTFQQILADANGQTVQYAGNVGGRTLSPLGSSTGGTPFVVLRDNGRSSAPFFTGNFTTAAPIPATGNVGLFENAAVTQQLQALNPGASVVFLANQSEAQRTGVSGSPIFQILQGYRITSVLNANLPLPSAGGVVGKTKLSDDANPLPRDRVFLIFDLFGQTVLVPGGYDVYRFTPGAELAFFDGWASAEVRFPFASTLDSVGTTDGLLNRNTEFGNINLTLKALALRGDVLNVAAGVGVSFPTADDAVLIAPNGAELLRVKNESYTLTPFVAALFTPDDHWFAQAWLQLSYDVSGSPVLAPINGTGPLVPAGRVHDQALLQADFQVGFWAFRNDSSTFLRGLAPFIELHYNRPMERGDAVVANGLLIGGGDFFNELNVSLGVAAVVGSNCLVSAGMAFPLGEGTNGFFNYQVGVRANWFFGPTARDMAPLPLGNVPAPMPGPGMPVPGAEPGAVPPVVPEAVPPGGAAVRAPETGGVAPSTFNPNFFGDLIGVSGRTRTPVIVQTPGQPPRPALVRVPILPRYVGLKPTDNDGPRPQDRAFFSYNHYAGVNESVNPPGSPSIHLNREIIGLETTLGSDASIAARLPFLQAGGSPEIEGHEVGDLTVVGKYALLNDPATGNAVTLGLAVTLPTGDRNDSLAVLDDGTRAPRAVFVQPWAGAAWAGGDLFAQGITALVLPTDPVYPAVWFNSVGVGYWLYRNASDALVQGVAPVAELHVNTPLTNRGADQLIFFRDQVNLTGGVYVQFPRLTLGGAVCVPLAGPRPYDYEAMVSLNFQF